MAHSFGHDLVQMCLATLNGGAGKLSIAIALRDVPLVPACQGGCVSGDSRYGYGGWRFEIWLWWLEIQEIWKFETS